MKEVVFTVEARELDVISVKTGLAVVLDEKTDLNKIKGMMLDEFDRVMDLIEHPTEAASEMADDEKVRNTPAQE